MKPYNNRMTRRSTAEVEIVGEVKNEVDIFYCF